MNGNCFLLWKAGLLKKHPMCHTWKHRHPRQDWSGYWIFLPIVWRWATLVIQKGVLKQLRWLGKKVKKHECGLQGVSPASDSICLLFSLCIWYYSCQQFGTSIHLIGLFCIFMKYYFCLLYCIYNRAMYCIYLSVLYFCTCLGLKCEENASINPNPLLSRDSGAEPDSVHLALWTPKNKTCY